ncbi:MAG TPA: ATP-dependent Zn protease [Coleofasciculaceae cyanobacterium]
MSQLSLNLVAIAIFTVTMTSLLGPLVHLSPAVPALVTAAALGLATIDNLSWQGQGSALLLDWIASFSPEHRDRVIHHEAGHFLVAHHLGIPVTDYTLTAWDAFKKGYPGQAGVRFDVSELESELEQGTLSAQLIDRYCTIWMAGIAAESLTYESVEGGLDDRLKLQGVLAQLGLPEADRQQKERLALLRAKTILQEQRPAYDGLVTALQQGLPVEVCTSSIGYKPECSLS